MMQIKKSNVGEKINGATVYLLMGIVFILGIVVSKHFDKYLPEKLSNSKKSYTTGYSVGFEAAKKIVEGSNLVPILNTNEDVKSISGTVIAVKGNILTLDSNFITSPFDEVAPKIRTIIMSSSTRIVLVKQKDKDLADKEMEDFLRMRQLAQSSSSIHLKNMPYPTQQYIENSIDFSDISIGDSITVTSAQNIKTRKEFTAGEIRVNPHIIAR